MYCVLQDQDLMTPARQAYIDAITGPYDENTAENHERFAPSGFNDTMTKALRARIDALYTPYITSLQAYVKSSGVNVVGGNAAATDFQL
jgi:hypothetical protein